MRQLWTAAILMALAGPVSAQSPTVTAGGYLEIDFPTAGEGYELGAYIDAEINGFYALAYFYETPIEGEEQELDLTLGYRGETAGGISYDVSYTRYYYPGNGGDCCGELGFILGLPVGEATTLTADLYIDPEADSTTLGIQVDQQLSDAWSLSARVERYDYPEEPVTIEWDVGATVYLNDATWLDTRLNGGDGIETYLGVTLGFDVTLAGG